MVVPVIEFKILLQINSIQMYGLFLTYPRFYAIIRNNLKSIEFIAYYTRTDNPVLSLN
jgi:hypothetical protein